MERNIKRTDWEAVKKPPKKRASLKIVRSFTQVQMTRLMKGSLPQTQDDKWFIFYEKGVLYFYRAWSGYCIYWVKFKEQDGNFMVLEALVNRDDQQYDQKNDEIDIHILNSMIDGLLHG